MAGKGDNYRPVNVKKYGENYEKIFRKNTDNSKKSESKSS